MAIPSTPCNTLDTQANQRIRATTARQDGACTAMSKEIANLTLAANLFRFLASNLRTDLEAAPKENNRNYKNGGKNKK